MSKEARDDFCKYVRARGFDFHMEIVWIVVRKGIEADKMGIKDCCCNCLYDALKLCESTRHIYNTDRLRRGLKKLEVADL